MIQVCVLTTISENNCAVGLDVVLANLAITLAIGDASIAQLAVEQSHVHVDKHPNTIAVSGKLGKLSMIDSDVASSHPQVIGISDKVEMQLRSGDSFL